MQDLNDLTQEEVQDQLILLLSRQMEVNVALKNAVKQHNRPRVLQLIAELEGILRQVDEYADRLED